MKKILISAGVVVVIALYAIFASRSNQSTITITPTPIATSNPIATSTTSTPSGSGTPQPTGQYKDGSYTGPITNAIYGKIQVVAIIQNGQLTNIQVPVYPADGGHTMQLSQQALPVLEQEAIRSQSASVNIVSGATQTSQGFQQSLAAALALAK